MTGQADVKWIWMAVALVVVAAPVLTVLVDREVKAMQRRITELERRIEALTSADRAAAPATVAPPAVDTAGVEERVIARLLPHLAAQQHERELDILRTLSAMRPAEPEFTEEYWVEAGRD